MNRKLTAFLMGFALFLANISVTMAVEEVKINWTGNLKISGFSGTFGLPHDVDNNPSTMTFQWTIDPGSSHNINPHTCSNPLIAGNVILTFPNGFILPLPTQGLLDVAQLLPSGPVVFPPGVNPTFISSEPGAGIVMQNVTGLDTILRVTAVDFSGSILTFEVTEEVQPGSVGTAAAAFVGLDGSIFPPADGAINSAFSVQITLDDFDGCAVPIPVMGNKPLLTLALMMVLVGAGFLYRYGDFKKLS